MTDPHKESPPQATRRVHPGPSWGLMLALIFLAMLIAIGFAWLFIHPFMARH
ncbi:MAG TPA: hypothetical protein VHZ25_07645 [Acidobacteriaceae bacterium]|nr:hypothetical protein [Acidobacteriaceae bacterium]